MKFRGLDVTSPINRLKSGFAALCVNVRAFINGGFALRNPLSTAIVSSLPTPIHTIKRLNDSTPNGPSSGYSLIIGSGTSLYCWNVDIGLKLAATGLSGNQLSMVPFRPNGSVQPWMYVTDSAAAGTVTLITKYLISGSSVTFPSNGMMKVRSDGVVYKMGIMEPQTAPAISTENSEVTKTGTLQAKSIPWTNYSSANSEYNYGETNGYPKPSPDGLAPYVVNCENASYITINSITGTATINGNASATPTTSGPVTNTYPAYYIMAQGTGSTPPTSATVIVGAFTDGNGNVVTAGQAPLYVPSVVDVGAVIGVSNGIQVPSGAVDFQIGIDSAGNSFSSNSGSFSISTTVTTDALTEKTSVVGDMTIYVWGDSPTSGSVSSYQWKNPGDSSGSGLSRTTSNADSTTTGNSFIFDCSFGSSASPAQAAGIPGLPGAGTTFSNPVTAYPMNWSQLNSDDVVTATKSVFSSPITSTYTNNTQFTNFNFCLVGNIFFPEAGNYTFVLTSHDDCIWGIGGGVTQVSAVASGNGEGSIGKSNAGQTITVVSGIALMSRQNYTHGDGGDYARTTVVVSVPASGIYPIEIDYDFWYHSGRILLLMASKTPGSSPTIISPLPISVRENTQYRYVYRSSATNAQSNPSPASSEESVPVASNTITSVWSPDPQIDVVDYYRIDSATSDFTYVNTGPNDNSGSGTNTAVTDSLTDTELGTQVLDYTNFEPFPSIDLPQSGICSVSGGVITWQSGGAIGGTQKGFNIRWLGGTKILIGSPTSLSYVLTARPTPASFQNSYTYPLGFVVLDSSNHYQKVTTAGTSQSSGTPTWSDSGGTTTSGGVVFKDQGTVFSGDGYVTQITISGVPDGDNLAYQIEQPALAAEPIPYTWGPSDNIPFMLGVGDKVRQGTLYWTASSNPDSAPDSNQLELTDPSEALVNGVLTGGNSFVATIKRAFAVMPNFFNALATVTGTTGSTWSVRTTAVNRGLFVPRCMCVSGGGTVYFRVDDGIHASPNGGASESITDETLYPLFPHEGSTPQSVVRNGVTIYPPSASNPQSERFTYQNGYMYWSFVGTDSAYHTLVFDEAAMGWIWDSYSTAVSSYAANEGESVQGILVGCEDGTIRQISSSGTETVTGTVITPAIGGQGWQHVFEVTVEYSASSTVTLSFIAADAGNGSYAPTSVTLASTSGNPTKYTTRVSQNKFKWLQMQFQSTDETMQIYLEGFALQMKDWAGEYRTVAPFSQHGGEGAEQ